MIKYTLNKQRKAQIAIVLSLLFVAPNGVKNCWGQAAGFAQSRKEIPATAESGTRRSFLAQINPFKQSEPDRPIVDTTTISQPVATNVPPSSLVAPRTVTPPPVQSRPVPTSPRSVERTHVATPSIPNASVSTSKGTTSTATASSVRSSLAGRPSSNARSVSSAKSHAGGVASALLDELEEDADNIVESNDVSAVPEKKAVRRSLRVNSFPSSLELLEDGNNEEPPRSGSKEKSKKGVSEILSTEEDESEDEELLDEEEDDSVSDDELIEEDDEEVAPLVAVVVDEPVARGNAKRPVSTKENVKERRLDAERENAAVLDEEEESEIDDETITVLDDRLEKVLAPTVENVRPQRPAVESTVSGDASDASLSTGRTPNVEVNTVGPRKLTVGQASNYTIRVKNAGTDAARKLVVTTELPEYVVDLKSTPSVGDASFQTNGTHDSAKRCVWKVGTLNPGDEQTLSLSLTPVKRASFDLTSRFDFERSVATAEVEVQEPILEALIEGRDSIEWGVEDRFRLRLRNIGNGDAENVVLDVSTGENDASQKLGLLRAGEEKTIEMSVKTVSDDSFTIDVHAHGDYGLEAKASKKVATLRGKLSVAIEAPDLQFVEGEFEALVRVRNDGNATLQNVDVVAQLPNGVEALSCSNQARRNDEKRRIYWVAPFIRPEEEISFTVVCRVNAAGVAKFEAVAVDQTGLVAQARSVLNVESIAVLAMRVNAPKEPVAVGKTCTYELVVENNGTRDARDINTGIFLGSGMKPLAVEDNRGYVYEEESKALFKKVDCLKAGESVVFRVRAEALAPGNQKVQAMLQSSAEDVSLLSEETTYCYTRRVGGSRENSAVDSQTLTAERTDSTTTLR